jgi:branched-chain amino acid transport system ATP-binding protein
MTLCLRLEGVAAGWGETMVLDGLSLAVEDGATVAVLGRNGVGKTTLLATIMGHTRLHRGRILFRGRDLAALPIHRRARSGLGYVPQEREIFPSLTVAENLTVAGADPARLAWVYDLFPRLAERRRHYGDELSGGEQQMLAIGRALMGEPALLLMDEPLEGLAPIVVEGLLAAMERLKREARLAILLVEQNAHRALDFAAHAIVLDRGRIVHDGPSRDLLAEPDRVGALIGLSGRGRRQE